MGPPNRTFQVATDTASRTIQVKIDETPGVSAENLSLATWGSSYVLANRLHQWKQDALMAASSSLPNSVSVLEIGAGTSLVGISAAAVWGLPVIVTDLPGIVTGLAKNISVNTDLLAASNTTVSCGTLDWCSPTTLHLHNGQPIHAEANANVILAADTVYAEDHPSLLTRTIKAWLAPGPHSRVILCYVLRHTYIDIIRDLWESFEAAGLESVEEGQQAADPDTWDDVAPFEWCVWRWKSEGTDK